MFQVSSPAVRIYYIIIMWCDFITDVVRLVRSLMSPVWELYMCAPMVVEDMITRGVAGILALCT